MSYVFVSSYGLRDVKERQESDFVPLTVERRRVFYLFIPSPLSYTAKQVFLFSYLSYSQVLFFFLYNINTQVEKQYLIILSLSYRLIYKKREFYLFRCYFLLLNNSNTSIEKKHLAILHPFYPCPVCLFHIQDKDKNI